MQPPRAAPAAAAAPAASTAGVPRPDAAGRFGRFGGKYVPETLIAALTELEDEYKKAQADPAFKVGAERGGGKERARRGGGERGGGRAFDGHRGPRPLQAAPTR